MYHVDLNYGLKKIAFLSSFSKSDFGDLIMGVHGPSDYLRPNYVDQNSLGDDIIVTNPNSRIQRNTAYNQTNFMQKVFYQPRENLNIDLGIHFSRTGDIPRYDRLIRNDENQGLYYSEWYYGPQEWLLINSQLTFSPIQSKFYDELKFVSSFQKFSESRNSRKFNNSYLNSREEDLSIFSVNLDFYKKISEKSNITYGFELIENKVGSFAKRTDINDLTETLISTRYPDDSSLSSLGLYVNYKTKVIEDVFFQSGVRYSLTELKADLSQNNLYYDSRNRIRAVEDVAEALFDEWEDELDLYSNESLRRDSERQLADTQRRYQRLLTAMQRAEATIDPVMDNLRDNVLYLKHNLNARAIASIRGELDTINADVDRLIEAMEAAIAESDRFISEMQV